MPPPLSAHPTIERDLWIDQEADRFETAWRGGRSPSIEALVLAAPPDRRTLLLEELLLQEWELRRSAGDGPDLGEYLARFPDHREWIEATFKKLDPLNMTTAELSSESTSRGTANDLPEFQGYELLQRIGTGGMGEVFLARKRDRLDEHRLALKLVRPLADAESTKRFLAEMETMARLQHPHIVPILDSGRDHDHTYFLMPYFPSGDLAAALSAHGGLSPHSAAEYVLIIAWAVDYLHSKQVVHRDLKPKNILLDEFRDGRFPLGRPWVTDFGLVKLLAETTNTSDQSLVGTVAYMAPEQAEGRESAVGIQSDIWALGVMLHELLTNERPFQGRTVGEVRYQILHAEPPLAQSRRGRIPRDLQRIVLKCLEKNPAQRYESVRRLIEDLSAFLRAEPLVHAAPIAVWERVERWSRRNSALATRLFVVFVLLLNIWINRTIEWLGGSRERFDPIFFETINQPLGAFWVDQYLLLAWAIASWIFQRLLDHGHSRRLVRGAWLLVDALILSTIFLRIQAARAPLLVGYVVLIVASGLWFDAKLVLWTCALCLVGYCAMALQSRNTIAGAVPAYEFLHFVTALLATGFLVAYVIRRARALYRLYETRPTR